MSNIASNNGSVGGPMNAVGNKRGRDFSYQEPTAGNIAQMGGQAASGVMPNYMGYFPPGVNVSQSMYQQMPSSSDVPVMTLPPLYVGPAMNVMHSSQAIDQGSDGTPAKKKHTSQWALEKRRARNRVTAAESRRKSKTEAQSLREEVTRLSGELKSKTELLAEYKEKFQMYENGQSKEEIARVVAQRRAAIAAAAAVVAAAEGNAPSTRVSDLVMSSRPDIPADGETARL